MIREEHQPTAAMVGGKMEVILGNDRRVIVGPDVNTCAFARGIDVLKTLNELMNRLKKKEAAASDLEYCFRKHAEFSAYLYS